MRNKKPACEVCFFTTTSPLKTNQIIICKTCKRAAHRFCYLPDAINEYFQCDMCSTKAKNPTCCICHNPGLLKRTEEGDYAHPVCLIFCKDALVRSYKQLSFNFLRSKRKSKSAKCDICSKSSILCDLFQCFERQCPKSAHYYCILKQQWKDGQETDKWVQELKIFKNLNFNFLEFFNHKFKKYVKTYSNPAYKVIFGESKVVEETPVYITYCRTHCQNLTNCFCVALEDGNPQIDWVFCDVCGKWYHFQCEEIEIASLQQGDYTCTCCRNWKEKMTAQKQPVLANFPRLHFYDLVYIQMYSEQNNYHLSASMKDLLKRVPFTCSIKNFVQNFKTKEMVTRMLKNTNFMFMKKLVFDKSKNKKQLTTNLQKNDKDLINILWKLDFIVSSEPIKAISGIKGRKYKVDEILGIIQKFEKKHSQGSNILKPVIKQLMKLKSGIKSQQEECQDQNDEIIKEDIQEITEILKVQIEKIKKISGNIGKGFEALTQLYAKINDNQFFKELLKDYINENRPSSRMFGPVFIYDNETDMVMETKMNLLFCHLEGLPENYQQCKQSFMAASIASMFNSSSIKVQTENIRIIRILQSYNYELENNANLMNWRNTIAVTKQSNMSIKNILDANTSKQTHTLQETQTSMDRLLQAKYLDNFFSHLHLKASCLARIYKIYPRVKQLVNQLGKQQLFQSFLKLYENTRKLIEGIYETSFIEEEKLDVDMLQIVKNTKIDRTNIYRFCTFFTEVCKYSLSGLIPLAEKILIEKGEEYLTLISTRSMVFQCQIEFKAASTLLKKYPYAKPKIKQLVVRNKQLEEILSSVTIGSLSNLSFIGSNMEKLKQAKEFCEENNLQFRINKIEFMMKLYQCKEEAFNYFPAQFVVKQVQNMPKKYASMKCPTRVDYYLLKKYIYKMKLLKYPQTDYLFMKLTAVYEEKEEYMNALSTVINLYNSLLTNHQTSKLEASFTKQEILSLIKSKQNDIVTCQPEEDEIRIICELYEELLSKMQRKMKYNCVDIVQLSVLVKQFDKFPFQPEPNGTYTNFCSYLKATSLRVEKPFAMEDEKQSKLKKNQLDQTSARGQQSHRSIQNIESLRKQIISKPRTLTMKQIEAKSHELKLDGQWDGLKQMSLGCNKIMKENSSLISKFMSNQAYTRQDIVNLTKMRVQYENQYVRVEIIENILNQLRIYEKALIFGDPQQVHKLLEPLSQSFYRAFYNKTPLLHNFPRQSGQVEPKTDNKTKRTKVILKK